MITIALATFAVTWLLVFEFGPRNCISRFRDWFRDKFDNVGGAVDCPVCASVWVSVPMTLIYLLDVRLLYPLVAVAVCIVLFGVIGNEDSD